LPVSPFFSDMTFFPDEWGIRPFLGRLPIVPYVMQANYSPHGICALSERKFFALF